VPKNAFLRYSPRIPFCENIFGRNSSSEVHHSKDSFVNLSDALFLSINDSPRKTQQKTQTTRL
jgi:hypothetical protein